MDETKLESQVREGTTKQGEVDPIAEAINEGLPKSMPIVEPGSTEEQIKTALRQVYDPEIGLEVIQLGLIREINLATDPAEVKMMLTTPFCPYGGWLIQQIKDISESVSGKSMKVTVMPDLWDPNYMEDPGLLSGW
jgi:metal-sulfur cluster biosynthetic enzyme